MNQKNNALPELMSPAGHWPQLHAAIEAGADAVYFGLQHFSARAKVGFTMSELPKVINTLHKRGVKGFVTFNTLVFDHELNSAVQAIQEIAAAGVDAVIVQDVGVAQLIRDQAPSLEVHGSTQMSVTSAEGVKLANSLGCSRVVLGRELSLADIRKIASMTDVELEVFVHGALCVSYSGQCFSSEAWGGRSANRGKCAQACRLPYDFVVDGSVQNLGENRYLLSPGDLYALEQIPELVDIGISCVKIEGRYKSAEYVAATTQAYRAAIDACREAKQLDSTPIKDELEQVYSRGLGPHFISGINHQKVVQGRAPRHRGRKAGEVVQVGRDSVVVQGTLNLTPGDGIVFDAAHRRDPAEKEEGGFIYQVEPLGNDRREIRLGHNEIDFTRIQVGDWVWRTHDPQLAKRLKPITSAESPVFTRPIDVEVSAEIGKPLSATAFCEPNLTVMFQSDQGLQRADKNAISQSQVATQLGRLGGTPFHLGKVSCHTDGAFVPLSLLNECRRNLVEQLLALRTQRPDEKIHLKVPLANNPSPSSESTQLQLHVLVRSPDQLDPAINLKPSSITLDYLELYGLRKSVEKIKAAGIVARVASPRILKPSEEKVVRFLLSLQTEIVVRSGGLLYQLIQNCVEDPPKLIGDFSLNVANRLSLQTMLEMGVDQITPTHDLNAEQISDLAKIATDKIEVIAFHHLPVFHTEHCVFCRFLSEGTDSSNCGHPCEKHRVALADAQGRQHPVMADVGCRNTVFGAEVQFDANCLQRWVHDGISNYRIEFVHESPDQVEGVTASFQDFLSSKISADQLAESIKRLVPLGTTTGSFFVPKNFKKLVQLS